jgi:quercetin dioxygenase-like cupin family protein
MQVVDLTTVECFSVRASLDVSFPVHSATGTAASAIVWIKLDESGEVPEHTDSAEELLYVVQGKVEAAVGDETGTLEPGQLAVVPAMAPHALRNVGDGPAAILGFFAGSSVVSTFSEPLGPDGEQVFVTGAPFPLSTRLPEPAAV